MLPETFPIPVYLSRHGLNPKQPQDGRLVRWERGERVLITDGIDKGRIFVVESERMSHDALRGDPQPFIREGYFEDDPTRKRWAKPEQIMWFAGGDVL